MLATRSRRPRTSLSARTPSWMPSPKPSSTLKPGAPGGLTVLGDRVHAPHSTVGVAPQKHGAPTRIGGRRRALRQGRPSPSCLASGKTPPRHAAPGSSPPGPSKPPHAGPPNRHTIPGIANSSCATNTTAEDQPQFASPWQRDRGPGVRLLDDHQSYKGSWSTAVWQLMACTDPGPHARQSWRPARPASSWQTYSTDNSLSMVPCRSRRLVFSDV